MRKICFALCVCLAVGAPAISAMIGFSTGGSNNHSWTVTVSSGQAVMSFFNNEVDTSDPTPDTVLNDYVDLPDMTLQNVTPLNIGGVIYVTATLVPDGSDLLIQADQTEAGVNAGDTVMAASVGEGGMLTVGNNFIAYSQDQDDLDVTQSVSGYSTVIDQLVWADSKGYDLDLSFGGDSSNALLTLLANMQDGSVSGTLSGQIEAVPEPMTLIILGVGGLGFLRRRQ